MLNELKTLNQKNKNKNHQYDNNKPFGKYDKIAISKWINKMNQKNYKHNNNNNNNNNNNMQCHSYNERISESEVNIDKQYTNKHSSHRSDHIINKNHSNRQYKVDHITNNKSTPFPLNINYNNNNNNQHPSTLSNPISKRPQPKSKVVPIIKYNLNNIPTNRIFPSKQPHFTPSHKASPFTKQISLNPPTPSTPSQPISKGRHSPTLQSPQALYDKLTSNTKNKNINTIHPFKEYYYSSEQNPEHRQSMEDFHNIVPHMNGDYSKSYFAIFDGHGGNKASIFCKDNHYITLNKCLLATMNNMDKSLKYSFEQIDKELNATLEISDQLGTTATVVVLMFEEGKRVVYCANVGDSKCYLLKGNGSVEQLTKVHTCVDKNEVERIRKMEGMVFNNRVFGSLMITRSIGDKEMKGYGVISTPTVKKVYVNEEEDNFVIIASDGLWDVIKEEQVGVFANEDIMPAEALCKRLVQMAKEGGSIDNISCIVIKL